MNPISIQKGDKEKSYQLWELLKPLTNNWVRQTYLEHWSKEDLKQQSYLILLDAIERYDEDKGMTFEGYYKTRLKVWKSKQRKRKTCESSNVQSIERAMLNHSEGSEEELREVERKLLLQMVMDRVEQLTKEEKEFFIDSVIKNISYQELMKKYNLKESSIRVRRKRIIDKLKKEIGAPKE